jgi:hypothetical protein
MPIKPEMRGFYPSDWPEISRRVRFERAAGMCQGCGRPHGVTVRCLPDGRWFDATRHTWRNGRGRPSRWPNLRGTPHSRGAPIAGSEPPAWAAPALTLRHARDWRALDVPRRLILRAGRVRPCDAAHSCRRSRPPDRDRLPAASFLLPSYSPRLLTLAVVVELALRPAIIPDRCSLTNKILLIFHLRLKRWLRVRVGFLRGYVEPEKLRGKVG